MWQELRTELRGLEIVTVALDARGSETAGPWIQKAAPEHPSLIDEAHVVDALFGVVNVPSGIWIELGRRGQAWGRRELLPTAAALAAAF